MSMIDTHAHLYAEEFQADLPEVVSRAREVGVEKVLLPNIDETSIGDMKKCVALYPDFFLPMMGLHPTCVKKDFEKQLEPVYRELESAPYIAIGEIGIDLYWDEKLREEQIEVFEEQLKWSMERDLPVSIHFRNATREVVDSIKRVGEGSLRGVFHSFGGTIGELETVLQLKNFLVGINGVLTFKNSGLDRTIKHCPVDRVILETDSPYLAPVPYRGKRNESSYLYFVLKKLSEVWQMSEEAVAETTTRNAKKMFTQRRGMESEKSLNRNPREK